MFVSKYIESVSPWLRVNGLFSAVKLKNYMLVLSIVVCVVFYFLCCAVLHTKIRNLKYLIGLST